jgi:hypothetical protein
MQHNFVQSAYNRDAVCHFTISVAVVQFIIVGSLYCQRSRNCSCTARVEGVGQPPPSRRIDVQAPTTVDQDGSKRPDWSLNRSPCRWQRSSDQDFNARQFWIVNCGNAADESNGQLSVCAHHGTPLLKCHKSSPATQLNQVDISNNRAFDLQIKDAAIWRGETEIGRYQNMVSRRMLPSGFYTVVPLRTIFRQSARQPHMFLVQQGCCKSPPHIVHFDK